MVKSKSGNLENSILTNGISTQTGVDTTMKYKINRKIAVDGVVHWIHAANEQKYADKAVELYRSIGKEPIVCKLDLPGFIVNRISRAVLDDARQTVLSGACTAEDYDKALMFGPGMRMAVTGQLLTIDLGTQGGLRNNAIKYNRPYKPGELEVADSVDEEIVNRPESIGNNRDDISKWRDHMLIEMLKLHGKL